MRQKQAVGGGDGAEEPAAGPPAHRCLGRQLHCLGFAEEAAVLPGLAFGGKVLAVLLAAWLPFFPLAF